MPKRARRDTLTGGTRDVNPQFMSGYIVQSGADATTTQEYQIPVQRLPDNGRAQVMEVLKVFVQYPPPTEVDSSTHCVFGTRNYATADVQLNEPSLFAAFGQLFRITTTGAIQIRAYDMWDCTDGDGHGVLVATDKIFVQVKSAAETAARTYYWKILYRWKDIPLAEYIGIVQSQT